MIKRLALLLALLASCGRSPETASDQPNDVIELSPIPIAQQDDPPTKPQFCLLELSLDQAATYNTSRISGTLSFCKWTSASERTFVASSFRSSVCAGELVGDTPPVIHSLQRNLSLRELPSECGLPDQIEELQYKNTQRYKNLKRSANYTEICVRGSQEQIQKLLEVSSSVKTRHLVPVHAVFKTQGQASVFLEKQASPWRQNWGDVVVNVFRSRGVTFEVVGC